MKFALILEAVDKASKAIKAVSTAQKAAGNTTARAAEKAARAQDKANKTLEKAGSISKARSRLIAAETVAMAKLNKVTDKFRQLQDKINKRGLNRIRAGAGQALAGARGALGRAAAIGAIGAGGQAGLAATFIKPAQQYSQLKAQLKDVMNSAADAEKALAWVQDTQMPPHGIMELAQGFVALRTAGIDPTKGALKGAADAATAQGKGLEEVTAAITAAMAGDYAALGEMGVQAQNQGKYIAYVFKDADGGLKRIRASSRDAGAQAAAMGEAMKRAYGGKAVEKAKTWEGMTARLGDVFDRIRIKIMSGGLYDFIADKIGFVNGEIDKFLQQLEIWEKSGDLQEWIKNATDNIQKFMTVGWQVAMRFYQGGKVVLGILDKIAGLMGGWQNLLTVLIALPLASKLLQIGQGLAAIFSGLSGLVGLGPAVLGIMRGLGTAALVLSRGFISLGIAIMTTPIGWIIAGIAAVAAAAYLIYKYWDKIGPYFKTLWDWVKGIFTGFWNWLKGFFTAGNIGNALLIAFAPIIGLPLLIYRNWDKIGPYFAALWDRVKSLCSQFWEWFKGIIGWETIAAKFTELQAGLMQAFADLWTGMKLTAQEAWNWLTGLFSWDKIGAVFETLKDKVLGIFSGIWSKVESIFGKIKGVWKWLFGGGDDKAQGAMAQMQAADTVAKVPNVPAASAMPAAAGQEQKPLSQGVPASGNTEISLNFAPSITISGVEPSAVQKAMKDMYEQFKKEMPRLMEEANRRKERLAY